MKIKIQKIRENAKLPHRTFFNDAGFDCFISEFADIYYTESTDGQFVEKYLKPLTVNQYKVFPQSRIACKLGFKTEIQKGYYCQIVPRSGISLWKGLTIINSPGTIDSGYRDEWIAIILNTGRWERKLKIGDKICQFIVKKIVDNIELEEVEELKKSKRGEGGFGSTGD